MPKSADRHTPIAAVGVIVIHERSVLLVRRRNPPNAGRWAIPGGKIRFGETLQQAAEREVLEETGIVIKAEEPVFAFDLIERGAHEPACHYVIIDLVARYLSGTVVARDDAVDAQWFTRNDLHIPDVEDRTREFLLRWSSAEEF